ncbi:MAG TPA: hypothetical protein VHO29_14480 [Marmoricola sp.]|nr:hypothetical protein [Marmoricola sp.]
MHPDTRSRLIAARSSLILAPVVAGVSVVTQPDLGGTAADRLAAMSTPLAALSAVAFLLSQLPMLVAFLAIGRLLLPQAPRLSAWGTGLAVVGCFGHTVFGGTSLVYLMMARDSHRSIQVDLYDRLQSSPVMIFSALGLLGTVLGVLLLGIGLFRTRTGPVWVGPAIWAFLLVEFVGSAVSVYASYLSVLLLGAAFIALAGVLGDRSMPRTLPEPDLAGRR